MPIVADQSVAQRALALHPQVALRPEPFGALLYHYDTRRLVFLKHPDLVAVIRALPHHATAGDTLSACRIAPTRYASFLTAIESLVDSGMLVTRSTEPVAGAA